MSGNGNENNDNPPVDSGTQPPPPPPPPTTPPAGTAPPPPPPVCPVGINYGAQTLFTGSEPLFSHLVSPATAYVTSAAAAYAIVINKVIANIGTLCAGCPPPCSCIPVPISFPKTIVTYAIGLFGIPYPIVYVEQKWAPFCF